MYEFSSSINPKAYNQHNIGLCQYFLGDKTKALEYMERALEMDPHFETAVDTREWIKNN